MKVCARLCAREGVDFGSGVGDGASSEEGESSCHVSATLAVSECACLLASLSTLCAQMAVARTRVHSVCKRMAWRTHSFLHCRVRMAFVASSVHMHTRTQVKSSRTSAHVCTSLYTMLCSTAYAPAPTLTCTRKFARTEPPPPPPPVPAEEKQGEEGSADAAQGEAHTPSAHSQGGEGGAPATSAEEARAAQVKQEEEERRQQQIKEEQRAAAAAAFAPKPIPSSAATAVPAQAMQGASAMGLSGCLPSATSIKMCWLTS